MSTDCCSLVQFFNIEQHLVEAFSLCVILCSMYIMYSIRAPSSLTRTHVTFVSIHSFQNISRACCIPLLLAHPFMCRYFTKQCNFYSRDRSRSDTVPIVATVVILCRCCYSTKKEITMKMK